MDRKPISTIVGKRGSVADVYLRLPTVNEPDAIRHNQIVLARVSNGAPVAFIDRDSTALATLNGITRRDQPSPPNMPAC